MVIFKEKRRARSEVRKSLYRNKDIIIQQMKEEWEEAEKAFKRKKRKEKLIKLAKDAGVATAKTLLALLAIGGVLTVAAITPNIFSAFGRSYKYRHYFKSEQFNKNRYSLKRYGLIKIKKINKDIFEMRLTTKGENRVLEQAFNNFKIQRFVEDGYWRLVMFDIPRKYNWTRDVFRQKLKTMGFHQLQESVFIFPYPCEREIAFLTSILNISPFVILVKTKDFSENKKFKEIFA